MRSNLIELDLFGQRGPIAQQGDAVNTPDHVAADMVRYFGPTGRVLEPCRGGGAFLRAMASMLWCEITEDRDFFAWTEHVDWVMSNPPYSITREFLRHAFTVADHVVFLLPARNIFSGYGTLREAKEFGGIAAIRWYGTGSALNFPMGNAIAAIYWRRGYRGPIIESYVEDEQPGATYASSESNFIRTETAPAGKARQPAPGFRRIVRASRAALSAFAGAWHGV